MSMKKQPCSHLEVGGGKLDDEYASPEEVTEAIRTLTDADHQKLMVIARYWHRQRYGPLEQRVEPEEILFEAITITLNCDRRWRKEKVSIVKHLDRVMESLSGHILEKRMAEARAKDEMESQMERTEHEQRYLRSSVEDQVVARQQMEMIQALFADDDVALQVLCGRAVEKTAAEIREELGLSKTEYATVTRRILRAFVKHAKIREGNDHD